jgi:hypothetical protein
MPNIFVRKLGRFGWTYAFEVNDEPFRGWRPFQRWAEAAGRRRGVAVMKATPAPAWPDEPLHLNRDLRPSADLF